MHSKSDLVWKKLITFEILSVSMDLESRDSKEGITSLVHFKSDLVWKKLNTFEILSVYMDVESRDSKVEREKDTQTEDH